MRENLKEEIKILIDEKTKDFREIVIEEIKNIDREIDRDNSWFNYNLTVRKDNPPITYNFFTPIKYRVEKLEKLLNAENYNLVTEIKTKLVKKPNTKLTATEAIGKGKK